MKKFILTVDFNGIKAHSNLDTEEINPDYDKVTSEEVKKAYMQLEFAIKLLQPERRPLLQFLHLAMQLLI